jgi:hypothetical protein
LLSERNHKSHDEKSEKEPGWSHVMNSLPEPIHEWPLFWLGEMECGYRNSATQSLEITGRNSSANSLAERVCWAILGTLDRLQPLFRDKNTFFVLNRTHRRYYWEELADVPSTQTLVQPSNRGTAPAIALAVREIVGRDPDCTIALFPSDHHYRENSIFQATIDRALQFAKVCGDRLLIIGAPATYPEVEYGWIQPRPIVL